MKFVYFIRLAIEPEKIKERIPIHSQAASLRMKYLLSLIHRCEKRNELIIVSQGTGQCGGYQQKKESIYEEEPDIKEVYLGYINCGFLQEISMIGNSIIWMTKNIRKDDVIITYNFDPMIAISLIITRLFRPYKLIIDFEELIHKIGGIYKIPYTLCEIIGIQISSGFITCSCETAKTIRNIRKDNPPIAMSYGAPWEYSQSSRKEINQGKLHLLYSGSLDNNRGIQDLILAMSGVEDIADLTITGKGPLSTEIQRISHIRKNIFFKGYLEDELLDKLLTECDVCINPTPANTPFSKYSFPSKIVFYLFNNKVVLSTRLEVLLNSPYQEMIQFYDGTDPQSFRNALIIIQKNFQYTSEKSIQIHQKLQLIKSKEYEDISLLLTHVLMAV
jgi:hypothetical protein